MKNVEFKPFITQQIENGQWECYHHAVHELTATGSTETDALQNALTMCEGVMDKNHDALTRWYDRAKAAEKTLEKARAVLAEHSGVVEWAKEKAEISEMALLPLPNEIKALSDLADALGGGQDG